MRALGASRTSVVPGGALAGGWTRNPLWKTARTVPSLDLRFADNKSLVDATTGASLVTFTRASSGTFVGSDGVLRTAVTNLLLRSEEFDNASWPKTGTPTVTANSSVSPDGTTTAELFTRTTTGPTFIQQILVKAASALTYTFSVYAKQSVGNFIALRTQGTYPARADVVFNLGTGAIASAASVVAGFASASATITPLVNGWYRLTLTATTDAVTNFQAVVSVNSNGGQVDGTDSVSNSACFLWGAQLEQSTTVGEYIPTTSVINSAPRFDHNPTTGESLGLLVEEARTNNLLQSEDFSSTWTLSNIAVTTNSVVAPDGTTTADTIAPPADGLTVTRFLRQNPILTTQQAYTLSVFVKVGTATTNGINLYVSDSTATNNFRANFNLFTLTTSPGGTGWAAPTATIVPYPNGWYRCILTGVTSTVHVSLRAQIYLSAFSTVPDTYGSIHVWGAQLEAGAFPTSYIPTTTAAATRSADVASITGTAFSSWYQEDEGTWFADFNGTSIASGQFSRIIELNDGTSSNLIRVQQYAANLVRANVSTNGAGQFAADNGSVAVGIRGKVAFGSAFNDAALVTNGASPTVDTAYLTPVGLTQLGIGAPPGGSTSVLNSTIRRITYWPTRLANSTLQSITQ